MKSLFAVVFSLSALCCSTKLQNTSEKTLPIKGSEKYNCAPFKDTTSGNVSLIYISKLDSFFLELEINKIKKRLDFIFSCDAPSNVVPYFFSSNNEFVLLRRPCGNYCSIIYKYVLQNKTILSSSYDDVFEVNLKNNILFIANTKESYLRAIDFKSDRILGKIYLENKLLDNIDSIQIQSKTVKVFFDDNSYQIQNLK